MITHGVEFILFVALVITVGLAAFTLAKCQSESREYFILLNMATFLFLLGYLLEITASSVDGCLTATKVLYLGSAYISPVFLLFAASYCEITIKKAFVAVLLIVPFVVIALVWTTEYHQLIYTSYAYDGSAPLHHLSITPGKLYYLNHLYALICMIAVIIILTYRLASWDRQFRPRLILLIFGALTPVIANVLFLLKLNVYGVNYTPLSLAVCNILFFISIIRYDMFGIIHMASTIALDAAREAFILVDGNMRFLSANPAANVIFPELKALPKGGGIREVAGWPETLSSIDPSSDGFRLRFSIDTPAERYFIAGVSPVRERASRLVGWIVMIQDVSDEVALLRELAAAASIDALTGIYNRRHFTELAGLELIKAERQNKTSCVVMFDLDHFKNVNDSYGHPAGDTVLRTVAARVREVLRQYDLFARYGGEEFILLLPGARKDTALSLAERIRRCIENKPFVHADIAIPVTVSVGVAVVTNSLEIALKNADEALYRAKQGGRNRVVWYEEGNTFS